MLKKALLLNSTFEVLNFIPFRKIFKLLSKDKCEIISYWDDIILYGTIRINYPAILRLNGHVKRSYLKIRFSKNLLMRRDQYCCQYCGKQLTSSQITIDHVIPKSQGGKTSYTNCVVSCRECNAQKANRTPEQASLLLSHKPTIPSFKNILNLEEPKDHWHDDWNDFLNI